MPEHPFLTYTLTTQPQPLLTSTPTADQPGTLLIEVSAGTSPVYCEEIAFVVSFGNAVADLFEHRATFACSVPDEWSAADQRKPDGGLQVAQEQDRQLIIFRPVKPEYRHVTASIRFTIEGTMSMKIGTSILEVVERSSRSADGEYLIRSQTFQIVKEEFMFYLKNLAAAASSKSAAQVLTRFAKGADIYLSWQSTGTSFVVYVDNTASKPLTETNYTVTGGITRNTTVFVAAYLGEEVIYDALTLTVDDPDLLAGSLDVTGQSTLAGVTMSGDLVTPGTVSANTIKTAGVQFTGNSVIDGDVTFRGKVTFEQDVLFTKSVTFQGGRTVFTDAIVIRAPGVNDWYLYPTSGGVLLQGSQHQYFFNNNGSLSVSVSGSPDVNGKDFMLSGDIFRVIACAGIPANRVLAFNSDKKSRNQAQWFANGQTDERLRIQIQKFSDPSDVT